LSWFIAAQGQETDPYRNDYLTSKWLGLIRPLVAGFDRPLTARKSAILKKVSTSPTTATPKWWAGAVASPLR